MAVHFLGRSAIVATGLFAAGFRGKELVKGSVGGALVMEASLLVWAMFKKREDLVTVPVSEDLEDGQLQPLTIAPVAPKDSNKPPKELPGLVDPDWDLTA